MPKVVVSKGWMPAEIRSRTLPAPPSQPMTTASTLRPGMSTATLRLSAARPVPPATSWTPKTWASNEVVSRLPLSALPEPAPATQTLKPLNGRTPFSGRVILNRR